MATGATMNYLLSAVLAPAILVTPKWQARLAQWSERVNRNKDNLISYLIVLRLAPLPPHWVVNVVCPHLGIRIPTFWISTFLGIMPVSIIHTQIGTTLDEMTSPADFHLISWRNFFGLAGVVIAVMIPVGLRSMWKKEVEEAGVDDGAEDGTGGPGSGGDSLDHLENSIRPNGNRLIRKEDGRLVLLDNDEEDVTFNRTSSLSSHAKDNAAQAHYALNANGPKTAHQSSSPNSSSTASSESTIQEGTRQDQGAPVVSRTPVELYKDDGLEDIRDGSLFNSRPTTEGKSDPLS